MEAKANKQILANICEFKPKEDGMFSRYPDDDILIEHSAFDWSEKDGYCIKIFGANKKDS